MNTGYVQFQHPLTYMEIIDEIALLDGFIQSAYIIIQRRRERGDKLDIWPEELEKLKKERETYRLMILN